ncbi:MAG: thioredoxin family protein [Bacteroidota bacterium]
MKEYLIKAQTYEQYRAMVSGLLEEGKVTGENQSESLTEYTRLNEQRINRIEKTYKPSPELIAFMEELDQEWVWLVLTEGWCGDAAQNLPQIKKLADLARDKVQLRLVLRDENLDLMDAYLTDGGRSIPKLICLRHDDLEELGTWGPRPAPVQEMIREHKRNPVEEYAQLAQRLHTWYAKDRGKTFNAEFLESLKNWQKAAH